MDNQAVYIQGKCFTTEAMNWQTVNTAVCHTNFFLMSEIKHVKLREKIYIQICACTHMSACVHAHTHKFSHYTKRPVNVLESILLLEEIHTASHRSNTICFINRYTCQNLKAGNLNIISIHKKYYNSLTINIQNGNRLVHVYALMDLNVTFFLEIQLKFRLFFQISQLISYLLCYG